MAVILLAEMAGEEEVGTAVLDSVDVDRLIADSGEGFVGLQRVSLT